MRTAYEASDAIEAHILQGFLEQEGIATRVVGAYLQGAIGELPAQGLVRLLVDEDDFDRARAAILRWEAASPL
jgi:hypothetical protein